ncbi:hypothetical protein CR513_11695, partial [Mucuna pruriens]
MDKSMIDAASGGALMDKTPPAARHMISNMASNTKQFGIRGLNQSQMLNEIGVASNQRLENQLTELTSLVRQLAVSQHQPAMAAKVCGMCTSVEHPTDMCPTLQESESDQPKHVEAVGGFQYGSLGQLITSNMEDNHFGQVCNKDCMQLKEQDLCRICLRDQQVTNSRAYNIRNHLSNSNSSSRECLLKATLHPWKI